MATSLAWVDDFGTAELTNGFDAPGDRFAQWMPLSPGKSDGGRVQAVALGTGITYAWGHRTNFGAKFSLRYIDNTDQDLCIRLKYHMEGGGIITVNTGDSDSNSYDCYLWPGTEVAITGPDPKDKKYAVTLSVINAIASEIMLCRYP